MLLCRVSSLKLSRTDLHGFRLSQISKNSQASQIAAKCPAKMDLAHLVTGLCAGSNASHSEPALKCAGFKLYSH